ncbi:hypothetical protein A4X06_0g2690 [Tilletia controversa]|uniref:Uncharacterized protein n=2 Tax=Tilletia TaxID=13289 RepID=A0A8X7SYJ0_9BASI|nr:hypothetical protein CF336_g8292 [Tilletia laevis]KAE8242861.1 hypothetical protein A4X03_0g7943 [Tilletia caries]KAE8251413.1 hypothetical protein A4X06_0g2690 [Tilletia controversa]
MEAEAGGSRTKRWDDDETNDDAGSPSAQQIVNGAPIPMMETQERKEVVLQRSRMQVLEPGAAAGRRPETRSTPQDQLDRRQTRAARSISQPEPRAPDSRR